MTRPRRIQYPGAFYHILNRGNNRARIFFRNKDMDLFLEVIKKSLSIHGIKLLSYCLMHNHYHLLIQTPKGNISKAMQYVAGVFTTKLNAKRRRDGHLFRGRYKSILIEEEDYLRNVIRYIRLNPVEAAMVADPYDWKYSSHKDVLNGFKLESRSIISHDLVNPLFSNSLATYTDFMQAGVDEMTSEFYSKGKLSPIFGSEKFVAEIKEYISLTDTEVNLYQEYRKDKILPLVLAVLSEAYKIPVSDIFKSRIGHYNYAKSMAIALLKELTNMTYREIAKDLKQKSAHSVKSNLFDLRNKFKDNPELYKHYLSLKSETSHRTT